MACLVMYWIDYFGKHLDSIVISKYNQEFIGHYTVGKIEYSILEANVSHTPNVACLSIYVPSSCEQASSGKTLQGSGFG